MSGKKLEQSDVAIQRDRRMMTLPECAAEAQVSRRFLEMEIQRGRLVAIRLSPRIVRIRRRDLEAYLDERATRAA